MLEREWVSVRDPDDDRRRYTFDVSFLLSNYRCIYGEGCPGIHEDQDPVLGCCLHGAYIEGPEERRELERVVREDLDATTMQFHAQARKRGGLFETDDDGELKTQTVDGGCIFLNRGGFVAGVGCALHHLAMRRGQHHSSYKPTVCWQVPLHRTIEEITANDGSKLEVHTIAAFERGTWGEGGADFGWWCTDGPEAFIGREPVYRSMDVELRLMVGDAVYDELANHLDGRLRQPNHVRFLPVVT